MDPVVTIRDLRNHGGDVLKRVTDGESVVVTRSGEPVARIIPFRRSGPDAAALLRRWRNVPAVDPAQFRRDIDDVLDSSL